MSLILPNKQSHQEIVEQSGSLPPRSLVHKNKRKKKKEESYKKKVATSKKTETKEPEQKRKKKSSRYPLIRLLAALFILLPLTVIFIYKFWIENDSGNHSKFPLETYYDLIQFENNN